MSFELKPLPYAEDALEPHMSTRTIQFHYGKHHKTYVDNLNKLIEGTDVAKLAPELGRNVVITILTPLLLAAGMILSR